ncbi:hypothetical protein ACFLXO_04770 [Chloroflexota bacterium]
MAYQCKLLKPALGFLDEQADSSERQQIIEIIDKICADPQAAYPDGTNKFYFPALPLVFILYKEDDWWIIYYKATESLLQIIHIGRISEKPHIRHT